MKTEAIGTCDLGRKLRLRNPFVGVHFAAIVPAKQMGDTSRTPCLLLPGRRMHIEAHSCLNCDRDSACKSSSSHALAFSRSRGFSLPFKPGQFLKKPMKLSTVLLRCHPQGIPQRSFTAAGLLLASLRLASAFSMRCSNRLCFFGINALVIQWNATFQLALVSTTTLPDNAAAVAP